MVSVLVPFSRTDEPHRARAWDWLARRWVSMDVEFVTAEGAGAEETFNLPVGVNRAARQASGDVFVIVEADVVLAPEWVEQAAAAVASGEASWALPRFYVQLTREATATVLSDDPAGPVAVPRDGVEWSGDSVSWCGGVVVRREDFERVGGFDERFGGWGGPDVAFGLTLDALVAPVTRIGGRSLHLWHPRTTLDRASDECADLQRRYVDAAGDRDAIGELVAGKP
jgi:glycosyltransferase involved in cell wall biosynthesis